MWCQNIGSRFFPFVTKHACEIKQLGLAYKKAAPLSIREFWCLIAFCVTKPEQEAPLTLRGQRDRCRNIKGEPQVYGSFPNPSSRPLFFRVWFYSGFGKPKLCTKFEVVSFSHCVNIDGKPPNIEELPSSGHAHLFFCVWFYDGPCQTPAARQIGSR